MIYCPECGTSNRDGSKFCNECGARLPSSLSPREGVRAEPHAEEHAEPEIEAPAEGEPAEEPLPRPEETVEQGPGEAPTVIAAEAIGPAVPEEREGAPEEERPPLSAFEILAGVEDALPVAPIIAKPHSAPIAPPAIPGADFESARLFEEIVVSRPVIEAPAPEGRWTRLWRWARRRLVYLLVALAVVVPFLVKGAWSGTNLPVAPAVREVYEAVEALPEGAAVLVAHDYDPETMAELGPQALAITHHLMSRHLRVMVLSLLPQGPALAQETLQRAAQAHPEAHYGRDHVNLGYLAGQEAALRAFAGDPLGAVGRDYVARRPLTDFAAMEGVGGIEDVALIVELAGSQEPLRWWIEQVGSRYDVALVAGVTAAAEPQVRPYYQSGQLLGLISGLPGAAQYERLIQRPASGVASLGAQSAAHLAIILLALLGSLAYWIGRGRRGA
ncbi:MAG TPA: zinc ribbon domain-containing protein [Anaerolineae bacterium]|nr:zinc ribbon domain-containing protein [Anaerolineae bacterium]